MAKIPCKGTALAIEISLTYTAIAQVLSISVGQSQSETYDSTALDTGTWKTKDPTGYSTAGDVTAEIFYDPALSVHKTVHNLMNAPAARNFRITYADAGATQQTFSVASVGFGTTVAMGDGLKGSLTLGVSGTPGFPT